MNELKEYLKTHSRMTVFRKLTKVDYISSYSHSGKFYSLKRIAKFDQYGVWSYQSVFFSKFGTLKKTLELLINNSLKGYSSSEIKSILGVKVEDTLLELVKVKTVSRKKISGVYIYYSSTTELCNRQELTRKNSIQLLDNNNGKYSEELMNQLKAALIIFFSTLNEKQRRLYAGLESLKVGYGGDKLIAGLLDIDNKTVAKGRQELLSGKINTGNIRESGGGRKKIKKKFQM